MRGAVEIVALGECLVDFVSLPAKDGGKLVMEGNAGGAPANVLAMAARLGRQTAFIGKVGQDAFGDFLLEHLCAAGVDTAAMVRAQDAPTTLAIVSLDGMGNRSFSFYRKNTADVLLRQDEVDLTLVRDARIFHFGSVSLTDDPARTTTLAAAEYARKAGVKVSYDPNYRPLLWPGQQQAVEMMRQGMLLADYIKLSDEEAMLLSGEKDPLRAARAIEVQYHPAFLAVTMGENGCIGMAAGQQALAHAYDVECLDSTGAGDAFWGAVLHRLLELDAGTMDQEALAEVLRYGNAAGSLVTTGYGATAPQPDDAAIRRCVQADKRRK